MSYDKVRLLAGRSVDVTQCLRQGRTSFPSVLKLAWLGTGEPDLLISQVSFRWMKTLVSAIRGNLNGRTVISRWPSMLSNRAEPMYRTMHTRPKDNLPEHIQPKVSHLNACPSFPFDRWFAHLAMQLEHLPIVSSASIFILLNTTTPEPQISWISLVAGRFCNINSAPETPFEWCLL
jgi:hypothetical protein